MWPIYLQRRHKKFQHDGIRWFFAVPHTGCTVCRSNHPKRLFTTPKRHLADKDTWFQGTARLIYKQLKLCPHLGLKYESSFAIGHLKKRAWSQRCALHKEFKRVFGFGLRMNVSPYSIFPVKRDIHKNPWSQSSATHKQSCLTCALRLSCVHCEDWFLHFCNLPKQQSTENQRCIVICGWLVWNRMLKWVQDLALIWTKWNFVEQTMIEQDPFFHSLWPKHLLFMFQCGDDHFGAWILEIRLCIAELWLLRAEFWFWSKSANILLEASLIEK